MLPSCGYMVGASLINVKEDAETISTFLSEYKESLEILHSYTKVIECLLLWSTHVAKLIISNLRRNYRVEQQRFLKEPTPQKV
jgi:hypothetical protein